MAFVTRQPFLGVQATCIRYQNGNKRIGVRTSLGAFRLGKACGISRVSLLQTIRFKDRPKEKQPVKLNSQHIETHLVCNMVLPRLSKLSKGLMGAFHKMT